MAMKSNPLSFHHVTKNHLNYSGAFQEQEKFLPFATKFLDDLKAQGVLVKDDEDAYYVYRQFRKDGRQFKGLVGLSSVADYMQDHIKRHENIRQIRLGFMVELCKTTRVLGEPTLLTYTCETPLPLDGGENICDFTSVDGKRHVIERISDPVQMEQIKSQLARIENFYLADGHHRSAAIAEFHNKFPQMDNSHFLGLLMEEQQLAISPFHRLVKPMEHISTEDLIQELSRDFEVYPSPEPLFDPDKKAEFGMYDGKEWYKLKLKYADHMMDVEILEKYIIRAIYNIQDSSTDGQISFLAQSAGLDKLENLIASGAFDVAFTLKACAFSEIREISDRHEVLPPKSTFIEPKLRAGMLIQEF